MSKGEHTPAMGPLIYIPRTGEIFTDVDEDGAGNGNFIGLLAGDDEATHAFGHLFTAAPELLADGTALVASLDPDRLNPEQFNAWSNLGAAIANARGSS